MHPRPHPLAHTLFILCTTGLVSGFAGSSFIAEPERVVPPQWNQPIAFTLEARSVETDAAFGVHVVRPVFHTRTSAVLVEAYGFEGEGELGLVGGGLVYRRALGTRRTFETNVLFEGVRSTDGFSYPQLGVGVAFSPDRWVTLRANGYLPLRGKNSQPDGTERWSQREGSGADLREVNFSRESRSEREPMRGFDVEAELRVPTPPRWVDPRLAIGYAYREAEERPEVYAGVTARGELHFAKNWVAEAEWRDDAHGIDQEWRVGIRFQMLFGGPGESNEHSDGKRAFAAQPAESDAREAERFLPAQRFPWPTVARGETRGKVRRGDARSLAPALVSPQPTPPPADCCDSAEEPLIFD